MLKNMRADRLISIVMLLQTRGKMTTAELAGELAVSRRTILRDIDVLSQSGVPLYTDDGHGGGVALDEGYRTTLTGLKESEVRALFLSGNRALLGDIGLGDAAESMQRKLSAALPSKHTDAVADLRQRIHIDPHRWWHDSGTPTFWPDLQTAVFTDRRARMAYENYSGATAERLLEPYSLVAKAGDWYLVARHAGAFKTYRVARIQSFALLAESFTRDPAFDLAAHWQSQLGAFINSFTQFEFTLRIRVEQLRFAQSVTPGRSEVLDADTDGWATLRVHLETLAMAQMIVFGLGPDCEIISPPELRAAMLSKSQAWTTRLLA